MGHVFDRYRDETVDRSVEAFLSRIITCRVFLAIATPTYVIHAINPPRNPTWVFDEYQAAMVDETTFHCIALAPKGKLPTPEWRSIAVRLSHTADRILPDFPPFVFEGGQPKLAAPAIITQNPRRPRFDEIHAIPADDALNEFFRTDISNTTGQS